MVKKGLSTVVTTVIMILLVLVAVGILWVVVKNLLSDTTEEISVGDLKVNLEIKNVMLSDGVLEIKVKRDKGEGDIDRLKFVIFDGKNSESIEVSGAGFDPLEENTFSMAYGGLIKDISVVPISIGSSGKESLGGVEKIELTDKMIADMGWIKYSGNPLLEPDTSSSWDDKVVNNPRILKNVDGSVYKDPLGKYWMYYTGGTYDYNASGSPIISLDQGGLAYSTDLFNWQRESTNPILPLSTIEGDYDYADTQIGTVLKDGDVWRMWYASNQLNASKGDNVTISYTNSSDGVIWTKYLGNPIMIMGPGNDDLRDVYHPIVIKDGSKWKMWYMGHSISYYLGVSYATADNPEGPWTKYKDGEYVFDPGYRTFISDVWKEDGKYYMYLVDYIKHPFHIRLATSPNGINWIDEGIILGPGNQGEWDDLLVQAAQQVFVDGVWYTFYAGHDGSTYYKIGVATSLMRVPTAIPE